MEGERTFYLFTDGLTDADLPGRSFRLAPRLVPQGRTPIFRMGQYLADNSQVDFLTSSPLNSFTQTAEIIAQEVGLLVNKDRNLQETLHVRGVPETHYFNHLKGNYIGFLRWAQRLRYAEIAVCTDRPDIMAKLVNVGHVDLEDYTQPPTPPGFLLIAQRGQPIQKLDFNP